MSRVARSSFGTWLLGASAAPPLVALRVLTSVWAALFVGTNDELLYRPLAWAACGALALGRCQSLAALGLWLVVTRHCRASYPLATTDDELLAALLFWSMLLVSHRSSRLTVGCFASFLLVTGPLSHLAVVTCMALSVWSLWPYGALPLKVELDARAALATVVLGLVVASSTVDALDGGGASGPLGAVVGDLGLLRTALPPAPSLELVARIRDTDRSTDLHELGLEPAAPAWPFLARKQTTELHATVRQRLSDRACQNGAGERIIDVAVAPDAERAPLLSFYCRAGRGRLVPRTEPLTDPELGVYEKAAREQTGGARLRALLRLAELRTAARELDEAARLLELVIAETSPRQREQARLYELLAHVRELGEGGS